MATPKMQKRQTGQKSGHILLYLMMRGDMTPKKSASPETASLTVVFAHSGRSRGAQKRSSGTADTHTDRDESAAGRAQGATRACARADFKKYPVHGALLASPPSLQ